MSAPSGGPDSVPAPRTGPLVAALGPLASIAPAGDAADSAPEPALGVIRADAEGTSAVASTTAARGSLRRRLAGVALVASEVELAKGCLARIVPPGARWMDAVALGCVLRPERDVCDHATLVRGVLDRDPASSPLGRAADVLEVVASLAEEIEAGLHDDLLEPVALVDRDWAWADLFRRRRAEDLGPLGRAARRGPRIVGRSVPPKAEGGTAPSPPGALDLERLLTDEARIRGELPSYRVREEQIELVRALLRAFREDGALAVEAGTGIGKTLAYALVAFLHAKTTGERVVISSANRTLQERVVAEELPAIARLLEVQPVSAVVMKGRANYGNPWRAREIALGVSDGADGLEPDSRLYLASWFSRCPRRDLGSFGGWLARRDPYLAAVRERIACSGDCDVRLCRREPGGACGYLARVDALGDAGVVSINHSLLLSWPARYGRIERLVIDEAHELVEEGDRAFAETLSARDVRGALRRVRTNPQRGLVGVVAARSGRRELLGSIDARIARIETDLDDVGSRLLGAVGEEEQTVPPASLLPPQGPWVDTVAAVAGLVEDLARLAGLLEEIAPEGTAAEDPSGGGEPDALQREVTSLARFFRNAAGGVLGDLFVQSREEHVYSARASRRRDHGCEWTVTVTPLDAAELIHARVLEEPKTVVALSATLGVGGDPSATLDKIGWRHLPRDRREEPLVLASPFDFARNTVLGLVRGPTHRDRGFEEHCARAALEVARLLRGRTLALFTSRARLRAVARRLSAELAPEGIEVLVQPPTGGAAAVVERFLDHPRSVLLGTRSLWQGIDVPGDALSCVLIDKLPFPQPNDPLLRGRQQRLRAIGEDPFRVLFLEPAVVRFKQMFGRLVRSETDRGFVVVLGADPTKPYIEDFLGSLPGPPRLIVDGLEGILDAMGEFFALRAGGAAR